MPKVAKSYQLDCLQWESPDSLLSAVLYSGCLVAGTQSLCAVGYDLKSDGEIGVSYLLKIPQIGLSVIQGLLKSYNSDKLRSSTVILTTTKI
ncbi:MAG: hypothetical protein SAL70_41140 [Scytonema sp. PMC 1070.18]|nr:hypothetical protein [Scytonema sp. PMC 1070.18]